MSNSIFDQFTGQYPVTKTLRFALNPIGETKENIKNKGLLKKDEDLAQKYKKAKKIIDEYHKDYINKKLADFSFEIKDLSELSDTYHKLKENKNDRKLQDNLKAQQNKLRKITADQFKNKRLFDHKFIREDLPKWLIQHPLILEDIEDPQEIVKDFYNWTTYFKGFNENRKNIYTEKEHSTSIAYRLIHENLPKFLDNIERYEKAKEIGVDFSKVQKHFNVNLDDFFTLKGFNQCLTQEGIDQYNQIRGGQGRKGNQKEQGINEKINLHAQQLENQIANTTDEQKQALLKQKRDVRSCQLEELYKQILSDRGSISFRFDTIENDAILCIKIKEAFHFDSSENLIGQEEYTDEQTKEVNLRNFPITEKLKILEKVSEYDLSKIYIKNDRSITDISQCLFSEWTLIKRCLEYYVEREIYPIQEGKKETQRLLDKREKWLKQSYFSFDDIHKALEIYFKQYTDKDQNINKVLDKEQDKQDNNEINIEEQKRIALSKPLFGYFKELKIKKQNEKNIYENIELLENIKEKAYKAAKVLKKYEDINDEKIKADTNAKIAIKDYLDTLMDLQHFLKPLCFQLKKKDEKQVEAYEKDGGFYSQFDKLYQVINQIIPLYNQTRNYLTKKPYSVEKYKLNFENPTLADGWDKNKEKDNTCVLFIKDKKYFLGIIDQKHKKIFEDIPQGRGDTGYQKIIYKLLPGANKMLPKVFFSQKNIEEYSPSQKVLEIRNHASHTKNGESQKGFQKRDFNIQDMYEMIDFFKSAIKKHPDWKNFNFSFSLTKNYSDLSDFYREVEHQGYQVTFQDISESHIDQYIEDGKLYLFEIYSKDFSPKTRGNPNLQTLYWQALFNKSNLENIIYKLNGEAELFHRKPSIKYSSEIWEKGHHLDDPRKKQEYPIIKNRRYAKDTYLFHVPITCNFKASRAKKFNNQVNELLKNNPSVNIIGIDRGERHLAYYTVINQKGEILKQSSFNKPLGDKGKDYHELLESRENERDEARKSWGTIEKIKDLKEGYLSQVVHKISKLMVEYNAIVVFEDLNFGFKRGRFKVEKQVYQKLEKALIDKLNYLVFKDRNPSDLGGIFKALQLTEKFDSFKKIGKQTGFIFYVPAYHTSKVCPATGFVNLLYPRYETISKAKEFFKKFDKICFNKDHNYFEFHLNYKKFTNKAEGYKQDWIVCSYGQRLENFKNSEKNNQWDTRKINLTEEMKNLLKENSIELEDGNCFIEQITTQNKSEFFKSLIRLLKLTLQMRNSKIGTVEDWLISPIKDNSSNSFDSRDIKDNSMPQNADANGAYHIALKGQLILKQLSEASKDNDIKGFKPNLSNAEWYVFITSRKKISLLNPHNKEDQNVKAKDSNKAQIA